jgi:GTP-binding protein Era
VIGMAALPCDERSGEAVPVAPRSGEPAASDGEAAEPQAAMRAGYVAILGRPNVGKSTLLNRILGEKISITSPKPQTTRHRVAGIYTQESAQAVFLDTPGILDPAYALQRALAGEVVKSLEGADLVLFLRDAYHRAEQVDATDPLGLGPEERALLARAGRAPAFFVLTKADLLSPEEIDTLLEAIRRDPRFAEVHAVSALTGEGVEELLAATVRRLPPGGFFFDRDQLTDRSMRFLAAELVRESLLEHLGEEVPYACHVEVTSYDESHPIPRIEAVIYVERESQKGIVIGRGGETLKRIGTAARATIEGLADGQVFLHLTVKVRHNWRRKEAELRRFGYRL